MKSKLIIPNEIVVGYQKRTDTYSGKLAYVVYKDDKGILRKENHGILGETKKLILIHLKTNQHLVLF
ncbi:MAG: hypothetical protein HC836_44870 [Richelia sp. RM2_1_2]|nr:hypothetical protein [Richelia sp. RM2_1_2]